MYEERTREEIIDEIVNLIQNGKTSLIQKRYDLTDKYFDDVLENVQQLEEAVGELHL